MAVTVTLVLLVMITGLSAADSDNPPDMPVYNDTCNYGIKCGDRCVDWDGSCGCGNDTFNPPKTKEQCCIPSDETCSQASHMEALCRKGVKIPMSSHCDNSARSLQCYNSYQDSQYLSIDSYFTCPDTCVSVLEEMCRGVSWCSSDVQECGPQLRCGILLLSNLIEEHFYCVHEDNENNQVFDSIDRSDEKNGISSEDTSYEINDTEYQNCSDQGFGYFGLYCRSGSACLGSSRWCDGESNFCTYMNISSSDRILCGNPLVFAKASCVEFSDGWSDIGKTRYITSYAKHCSGTNKQCYNPWYTQVHGYRIIYPLPTCADKSDEVFQTNISCWEHFQINIEFHDAHFCNSSVPSLIDADYLICKDKVKYLNDLDPSGGYMDPHNCMSSCSNSSHGLNCTACSNPSYFQCSSSDICLHPQLECDGHPQCPGGEDENLEKCQDKYVRNQIIGIEASYKCTSKFYDNMEIFSTPCDKVIECADESDERGCNDNKDTNCVLGFFTVTVFFMFFGLRYFNTLSPENKTSHALHPTHVLRKYKFKYEDQDSIDLVNLHLLNSMKKESVEDHNEICVKFFDLEARLNNNKEPETYHAFHKRLDPTVAKSVVDEKFPGCLDGLKSCLEEISRSEWIKNLTNWVTRTEWAKKLISNITAVITIEFKFIDLYKDLGLSVLMLILIGGPQAIIDNPTFFSSAIVIAMFTSVFLPITISSIHLMVNNRHMLMRFVNLGTSRLKRIMIAAVLFLLAPFHPVLLDYLYLVTSEEARTLIQNYDPIALQLMQECRRIQVQNANILKIELGKLPIMVTIN